MKLKNLALWGAVLLVFAAFTVNNASAAEWPIEGTVVQVGSVDGSVWLAIRDVNDAPWGGPATSGQDAEILSAGLTALVNGLPVTGFYNTSQLEWNGLIVKPSP
jgi:hypothetical protein